MRGLNAPPRRAVAPAFLIARAEPTICSSLSTEQGPAMTPSVPPPTVRLPARTTVGSDFGFDAREFVRREHGQHFVDAGAAFENADRGVAFVANRGDDGPLGASEHGGLEAERFDLLDHVIDILWFGIATHDDDHVWFGVPGSGLRQDNGQQKKPREPGVWVSGSGFSGV